MMLRFITFVVVVSVVYYLIKGRLRGKTIKNVRHRYGERTQDTVSARLKEIAYVFYSAVKDSSTCDVCMALDGRHLLPGHKMLSNIKPPHAGCKNTQGCRCTLVYVTRDEEGGREIESFLRKHGGMCDRKAIEKAFPA
ncbi:MAG: hypothetical protein E3K32_02925 [wastewater metagenome]|nr:hypothetical protein [Candidatus Loosdrechtia aerotolerans]